MGLKMFLSVVGSFFVFEVCCNIVLSYYDVVLGYVLELLVLFLEV